MKNMIENFPRAIIFINYFDKKTKYFTQKQIVLLGLGFIFIGLFFRNSAAIYPGLLDEFYYNQYARLLPLSDARYGNFLYYLIYRATNICGNGFLSCAYFLNDAFYVSAFFPIYAIAKRCCDHPTAVWISFLAILTPFNIWTAFFMPESLYFLVFWLYVWVLLAYKRSNQSIRWIVGGAMLGICALIKIHAFFLLPASWLYIIFASTQIDNISHKGWIVRVTCHLLGFTITALCIKLVIGYLLAGTAGLTLFGAYGGMVSHASDALSEIASINQPVQIDPRFTPLAILQREGAKAIWVNVLPIFLLFSPALIALLSSLMKIKTFQKGVGGLSEVKTELSMLTFLLITSIVIIITLYQLVLISKGMGAAELYWRYYEFAFPLLFLVSAASISNSRDEHQKLSVLQLSVTSLFLLIIFWAMYRGAGTQWISLGHKDYIFYGAGALSILILMVLPFRFNLALKIFIFCTLPCVLIASNFTIYKELKQTRIKPNDSSVGQFINSRLSKSDLSKLVVVQDSNLTQTVPMMYFDQAPIEFIFIPESQNQYDVSKLPSGKDWVLLMGNHELVGEALSKSHQDLLYFGGMTLFGGHGVTTVDFKNAQWRGVINNYSGLFSPPESWGAWSIGDKIRFEFAKPLPRKFNLILNARAYGPNLNENFILKIGSQAVPFRVKSYPEFEQIIIPIENFLRVNVLEIDIPKSISPKEMGLGDDSRKLGIGLTQLQIQW